MNGEESKQLAVIGEQISGLVDDVKEVKTTVKCIDQSKAAFERECIRNFTKLESSSKSAHRRIDDQTGRINKNADQMDDLQQLIRPLITTNKVIVWVGGLLGGSVLLLIWMILIGQVTLNFP